MWRWLPEQTHTWVNARKFTFWENCCLAVVVAAERGIHGALSVYNLFVLTCSWISRIVIEQIGGNLVFISKKEKEKNEKTNLDNCFLPSMDGKPGLQGIIRA